MTRPIHTAVITGPTGAIGHALCARLLSEGIQVCAVVRPGSPRAESLAELLKKDMLAAVTEKGA